jgi:hypothetical protein
VNRLGELSPFWSFFITGVAKATFSTVKVLQKLGWATFWAIFSQTHLVTLTGTVKVLTLCLVQDSITFSVVDPMNIELRRLVSNKC